jgi:hypothetical protein
VSDRLAPTSLPEGLDIPAEDWQQTPLSVRLVRIPVIPATQSSAKRLMANFGERQVMAQPVARRLLVSLLVHKDFRVCYPLLARGDCASAILNHQNWTRT